jgi:hypothetical protein
MVLLAIPRGSSVTTVKSLASTSASSAKCGEAIGEPMTTMTGPVPRTS